MIKRKSTDPTDSAILKRRLMASAPHHHDDDDDGIGARKEVQLPQRACAGADAQQRVSRQLLAFAARSFGPRGRATLLQQNARCADALVLTATAGRYLQHAAYSSYRVFAYQEGDCEATALICCGAA